MGDSPLHSVQDIKTTLEIRLFIRQDILCAVHGRAGAAHGVADGEAGARHQGHQQQQRRTDRGAHREAGEGPGHPRQEEKGQFSSEIYRDYLPRPSL